MSFILEALKKSENKRRKEVAREPRSIHEPTPSKPAAKRTWIVFLLAILAFNMVLLGWFLGPWREAVKVPVVETPVAADKESSAAGSPGRVEAPTGKVELGTGSPVPTTGITPQQPAETAPKVAFPVPRNDKRIYSIAQLPPEIQRRIPEIRMALHAYNRNDSSASMVQLNERIMREGDRLNDDFLLEQINSDGVVLRYDGYRFLVPRRGN